MFTRKKAVRTIPPGELLVELGSGRLRFRSARQVPRKLAVLVAATALIGSVTAAMAVHADGLFELDTTTDAAICAPLAAPCGNANTADQAAAGADWDSTYNDSSDETSFDVDPVGAAENSYYTGGGSKDVRPIGAWGYGTANDPVPDKDDIAHGFTAAYIDPADNHQIIYFGIDRFANNGDAETGFWFFQNPVSLDGNGGFDGHHVDGDVLVLANWGGSNPVGQLTIYQWVGETTPKAPLALVADSLSADCATAPVSHNFCAVVNRQVVNQAWNTFTDKGGFTSIQPLELFEAGLDVNALFGDELCFSSFLAATRSSHSPTAQLKDFVLGPFEECGASLSTDRGADDELVLGDSISDTATVHASGGSNPPAPTGNVTFKVSYEGGAAVQVGAVKPLPGVKVGNDYTVTSDPYTPTKAGDYCFSASWPGDATYTGGPYVDDGSNECFSVAPNQPNIVTQVNTEAAVSPGTPINDTATMSGLATPSGGTGGTITFTAYGPDDADCSDPAVYTTVVSGVIANTTYSSTTGNAGAFAPTAPGTYYWVAVYAPGASDVNNLGDTTACGDAHESSIVQQFQPTRTTAQTWTVKDSMTILVTGGGALAGTAHFELYANSTCTGTALNSQDIAVAGASGTTVSTLVVAATTFTTSQPTLYWKTSYTSTNASHANIAATCTENSVLTVTN